MFKFTSKLLLISATLFLFGFNFFITPAKADDYQLSTFAKAADYNTKNVSIEATVQNILKIALSIMGILFLAFAIYAGMRWMTAQGNEEHVTRAKDTLEAAVIGLIIISISYAVTNFIFESLTPTPTAVNSDLVVPGGFGQPCVTDNDCDSYSICSPEKKCTVKCTQNLSESSCIYSWGCGWDKATSNCKSVL